MRDLIGKDNPAAVGREIPIGFGAIFLKLFVLFQVVVEAEHELVVRRAQRNRQAQFFAQELERREKLLRLFGKWDAFVSAVLHHELLERIRGDPVARIRRIDICEKSQDPVSMHWP